MRPGGQKIYPEADILTAGANLAPSRGNRNRTRRPTTPSQELNSDLLPNQAVLREEVWSKTTENRPQVNSQTHQSVDIKITIVDLLQTEAVLVSEVEKG